MKLGIDLLLTTLSKTSKQVGILILSIVLTRHLTQLDYGTYLHVQLIANVAIWSFMLGIPHSIYYFLPKVSQQQRFLLTTLTLVVTIATAVGLGIVIFENALVELLNNPSLKSLILITAGLTFLQIPQSIFEPTMIATNRVRTFIVFDVIFNIGFFLAILIPTILTADINIILLSLTSFHALQLLIILSIIIHQSLQFKTPQDGLDYSITDQMKYSLPIGASQGVFELARYGDKIIVSHFFDPTTLAIYTRGAMDIPLLMIINNTVDNLIMPQLMEAYKNQCAQSLLKLWHDAIALTATFIYPSFCFLVMVAPYLIPGLYGDSYAEAVPIFQIYTCGLIFRVSTYNVIARVIGKTGIMAKVALISETVNILGTLALVHYFGLLGAPFATVVASGLIVIGYLIGISHQLQVTMIAVFPWRLLGGIALLSAAAVTPLIPVHLAIQSGQWPLKNWPAIGIMAAIYSCSYWILMRFLPVLSEERRALLRMMLPGPMKILV